MDGYEIDETAIQKRISETVDFSLWSTMPTFDPSQPASIPLPPEPPRDRVIEAVCDGRTVRRWVHDGAGWVDVDYTKVSESWADVVYAALDGELIWSLRHVPGDSDD